jgi:D-alanyl-D-alanine-carboxypeptidase/D-alanyl-D-alanine-endopeptidase
MQAMTKMLPGARRAARTATLALALGLIFLSPAAQAKDKLLEETIGFTGELFFLESKVPGLIIGVVRNGETAVAGFGKISAQDSRAPDGKTLMRIGSITKVFTGAVLASLASDRIVSFTDPLQKRLNWGVKIPSKDGKDIRLIDLVTHTSGLPREADRPPSPPTDPFGTITKDAFIKNLQADPLLFPPGTGALYSNFAFDLLAQALAEAAGKPYEEVLRERVLARAGMSATVFTPGVEQRRNLMQGHNFDGTPMPEAPTPPIIVGSGGLYTTADDMLRWLGWHLDRFAATDAELRLLDHAAYVYRDGLNPVFGLDESGRMDAMGLGWIVMMPEGGRPQILQKAGGLQGVFSYTAFAPARRIGVFMAINQFNLDAGLKMAATANALIATLAPR